MTAGIVGAEASKFTRYGEAQARTMLRRIISDPQVTAVVSGGCHLGGIDRWAIETAIDLNRLWREFVPRQLCWEEYRRRNLQIVHASSIVHCITVPYLPAGYTGMTFKRCYHCDSATHVKSGGCWTMKQAIRLGKQGKLWVVRQQTDRL